MVSIRNTKRAEKVTPGSHRSIGNFIKRAKTFQKMEPSLEKDSIDSNDLHGRPQGAQGPVQPRDTFPAFRPYTPRMKYLPGGPHLPQIRFLNVNSGSWYRSRTQKERKK